MIRLTIVLICIIMSGCAVTNRIEKIETPDKTKINFHVKVMEF
jgi:hypothetical protein